MPDKPTVILRQPELVETYITPGGMQGEVYETEGQRVVILEKAPEEKPLSLSQEYERRTGQIDLVGRLAERYPGRAFGGIQQPPHRAAWLSPLGNIFSFGR